MTSDTYDSDDAMNRSPPLVAQTIKYGVDEDLPPFVRQSDGDTEHCAKGTPGRSRKPHLPESQTQTRYGDSVLINYLAPDRPDIAEHAWKYPLTDGSPKRERPTEKKAVDAKDPTQSKDAPPLLQGDDLKRDGHQSLSPRNELPLPPLPPISVGIKNELVSPRQRPVLPSLQAPDRRASLDRPRLSPPYRTSTQTSPDLKARVSLPSLPSIHSPPSSCAGPSPDTGSGSGNNQVLPSIHSALSALSNEFPLPRPNALPPPYSYPASATSRNDSPHDRQLPQLLPHQIPPSPFSHFSPVSLKDASNNPSPASQPTFWQRPPVPPPPPPPEPHHPATPYDTSPMTAKSPATSYPTPTEQVAPTPGTSERTSFSQPSTNGAQVTGNYKCTHPGCTAPPFQTQYLLNSHANVHSQERPHFCPVEGCPRGVGGKGFKRKNEMMRHGLVHNSPGYVCPFCPDQQHKYPRPDNLQRHVRVHHVDKDKDDPILRQVLAQRPPGSTRGRRRRINSG